jgi:hypothetical protein
MLPSSMMTNNLQMNIAVTATPYVKPTVDITNVEIRVMNLILFTSVSINVILFGANNAYVDSKQFTLSGSDYTNWSNDDTYIVNYVLTQLGLTQAPTA